MSVNTYAKIPTQALAIARKLTKAQYDIWTYLWEIDPFGNFKRQLPTPSEIAEELGLHERTVTRACDKLQDLGLFDFEIQRWSCINNYGSKSEQAKEKFTKKINTPPSEDSRCYDTNVQTMTTVSNFGQACQKSDTVVQNLTQRSNFGQACQNRGSEDALKEALPPSHKDINKDINKSLIKSLINDPNNFQKQRGENLENFDQENSDREISQVQNSDQENSEEEFLREEVLQETDEMPVAINSENSESESKQIEKPVKPQRQAEPENLHNQNSNREATSNIQNLEDGQGSAAAPSRFFANLSEFVIHEAKQDPAIKSPEIWANTCLRRNPEEWQAKWDKWEKQRAITTTYKPEVFTPPDPEVARRAIEEARRLLPEWMRRNCG